MPAGPGKGIDEITSEEIAEMSTEELEAFFAEQDLAAQELAKQPISDEEAGELITEFLLEEELRFKKTLDELKEQGILSAKDVEVLLTKPETQAKLTEKEEDELIAEFLQDGAHAELMETASVEDLPKDKLYAIESELAQSQKSIADVIKEADIFEEPPVLASDQLTESVRESSPIPPKPNESSVVQVDASGEKPAEEEPPSAKGPSEQVTASVRKPPPPVPTRRPPPVPTQRQPRPTWTQRHSFNVEQRRESFQKAKKKALETLSALKVEVKKNEKADAIFSNLQEHINKLDQFIGHIVEKYEAKRRNKELSRMDLGQLIGEKKSLMEKYPEMPRTKAIAGQLTTINKRLVLFKQSIDVGNLLCVVMSDLKDVLRNQASLKGSSEGIKKQRAELNTRRITLQEDIEIAKKKEELVGKALQMPEGKKRANIIKQLVKINTDLERRKMSPDQIEGRLVEIRKKKPVEPEAAGSGPPRR